MPTAGNYPTNSNSNYLIHNNNGNTRFHSSQSRRQSITSDLWEWGGVLFKMNIRLSFDGKLSYNDERRLTQQMAGIHRESSTTITLSQP